MLKRYRGFLLLPFLLLGAFSACAKKFDIDTLQFNGQSDHYINLVILGDGYTASELKKYLQDARTFTDYLFTQAPFQAYKSYFNVFAIQVISAESGIKHPATAGDCYQSFVPVSDPDNYLGTSFDKWGLHRLVVPNANKVAMVLASHFPAYDQVVVLANTSDYGGSGGTYATATINTAANQIAVHEIGHSFAGLADEYWAGEGYALEKPNMTREADPARVKWKNWLTPGSGIGIYPFANPQWFKPAPGTCKMEFLHQPFCAVCAETIIERIHSLLNPIGSFAPDNRQSLLTTAHTEPFFVSLQKVKPKPNTLKSEWQLNGLPLAGNADSIRIVPLQLQPGLNHLSVSLIDTTSRTRSSSHQTDHRYTLSWSIDHSIVLPVSLTSFTGEAGAAGITLSWTTASEVNNDRFEIERSSNGLDWQLVGTVKGHGTTQSPRQYSFLDPDGEAGLAPTLYYRLKQCDSQGGAEYSAVVAVRPRPQALQIRVLGNPVAANLQLQISGLPAAPCRLDLYAPNGSLVLAWPLPAGPPSRHLTLPVAHLAPGVYLYSLAQNGQVLETGRFVKQAK